MNNKLTIDSDFCVPITRFGTNVNIYLKELSITKYIDDKYSKYQELQILLTSLPIELVRIIFNYNFYFNRMLSQNAFDSKDANSAIYRIEDQGHSEIPSQLPVIPDGQRSTNEEYGVIQIKNDILLLMIIRDDHRYFHFTFCYDSKNKIIHLNFHQDDSIGADHHCVVDIQNKKMLSHNVIKLAHSPSQNSALLFWDDNLYSLEHEEDNINIRDLFIVNGRLYRHSYRINFFSKNFKGNSTFSTFSTQDDFYSSIYCCDRAKEMNYRYCDDHYNQKWSDVLTNLPPKTNIISLGSNQQLLFLYQDCECRLFDAQTNTLMPMTSNLRFPESVIFRETEYRINPGYYDRYDAAPCVKGTYFFQEENKLGIKIEYWSHEIMEDNIYGFLYVNFPLNSHSKWNKDCFGHEYGNSDIPLFT